SAVLHSVFVPSVKADEAVRREDLAALKNCAAAPVPGQLEASLDPVDAINTPRLSDTLPLRSFRLPVREDPSARRIRFARAIARTNVRAHALRWADVGPRWCRTRPRRSRPRAPHSRHVQRALYGGRDAP